MKINFVTTNKLKFSIAERFFEGNVDFQLVQIVQETPEIQATSCEEIAAFSAQHIAKEIGEPCVVMDAGFFIPALGGFPGPFVKQVNNWLAEEQIIRMLTDNDNRSAYFVDALAIGFPDGTVQTFTHETHGTLAHSGEYNTSDWPVNSLFIPNGHTLPLGSMTDDEQSKFWAEDGGNWAKLIEYLSSLR